MSVFAQLAIVVIDCGTSGSLAEFYRTLSGWEVTYSDADCVYLGDGGPIELGFQRVEGYLAFTGGGSSPLPATLVLHGDPLDEAHSSQSFEVFHSSVLSSYGPRPKASPISKVPSTERRGRRQMRFVASSPWRRGGL
jgi:hypothetical protein